MLINHEREKLINAIIYFAKHTSFLGKIKLCKLLYFLDFEHFKETGRSVTGLNYFAWPKGPVPVDLFNEVNNPKPDLAEKIIFSEEEFRDGHRLNVKPLVAFDPLHFSKRELGMLESLAREFEKTRAEEMIEATHLENLPWDKTYNELGLKQQLIPYELALRHQEKTEMRKLVAEREDLINNYGNHILDLQENYNESIESFNLKSALRLMQTRISKKMLISSEAPKKRISYKNNI